MKLTDGPTKRDLDEAQAILDGTLVSGASVLRNDIARATWRARYAGYRAGLEAAAGLMLARHVTASEFYAREIRALADVE